MCGYLLDYEDDLLINILGPTAETSFTSLSKHMLQKTFGIGPIRDII